MDFWGVRMNRKIISLILAFVLAAAPLLGGAGSVSAASQDTYAALEAAVDKQIRAFGDSIDKSNADDDAALALAGHGMSGRGKTLKAGKTHALTATLFNSELLQNALTDTFASTIRYMQRFGMTAIPMIKGNSCWYGADSFYYSVVHTEDASGNTHKNFEIARDSTYTGKWNAYDKSLDWMAANTAYRFTIQQTKLTATEAVYSVSCTILDRFDFSTSSSSGFKNLISGIGAAFFKEFDWESSVSFQLKIPLELLADYSCTHAPQVYRWTYDSEDKTFTNDVSGDYTENGVTQITYVPENSEKISYYHELEKTIRLYHNEPWVLEYDVKNPGTFVLAPLSTTVSDTHFSLMNRSRQNLWFRDHEYVTVSDSVVKEHGLSGNNQYAYDFYGTELKALFSYNTKNIYTLHLENEPHSDGTNMVYLTVYNKDTRELLLDKAPMDAYTRYEGWIKKYVLKNESDSWISGKDLFIQYIGNKVYPFSASHFELRVWENGVDSEVDTYCKTKVTKPTCTAQGYTTYTCTHCGYSYQGDKVKAKGHSFGDWTTVTAATCTDAGEEQRKCKNCDHSENRTVDALGHNYENYVCTNCGDMEYIPGDTDLNGTVDVDDVLALLWNVLFPEDYPIEVNADFDGNGTTDVDDVLALLWHVLFPEEYPLN